MEWYPAFSALGCAFALYPGLYYFVSGSVCVCFFACVCLSVDRSDTSFICFELSVDNLSVVQTYSV